MGTHPIFESDFDCLTDWENGGSQRTPKETDLGKNKNKTGRFQTGFDTEPETPSSTMPRDVTGDEPRSVGKFRSVPRNDTETLSKSLVPTLRSILENSFIL